jgi:2-succinyl-5-enolpyruvyl-6-hydroxy-3-cyclohexene-1-carboxylate synthase
VAAAFGLAFERAQSREALRCALDRAARHPGVTIVEAVVPADSAYDGLHCLDAVLAYM